MAKRRRHSVKISGNMTLIGTVLGLFVWVIDAYVDAFLFRNGDFFHQLLRPSFAEFILRVLIIILFVGFSVYSARFMRRLKLSEEELRNSEERYRTLVEAARDVIYTVSTDGLITSINPALEVVTGWRSSEIVGRSFCDLVHPDDLGRAVTVFEQALQGSAPDICELRIRSKAGSYLIGEFMSSPQMRDGAVVGVLGIARDITERKKIEQSLQESEVRYRDLFENANDLIQCITPDGKFQYVNRSWRETLGYGEEEIRRLTILDLVHPDSRVRCMEVFQAIMSGDRADRVQTVFVTKDGKPVMVEGSVNCKIVHGRPVAVRGIFRNITEHRHAEEFINRILETVDEGFIIINPDFQILSVNKAYCTKMGMRPEDIIGRHCYAISHHISRPCYEEGEECAVKRTFETDQPYTAVHQHYDGEGKTIFIEIKSFPLKNTEGKTVSAIEIHNDITERKRLEEQLRHAQKMEAVGTLAGGIAHDFNNILTAIIGYSSLLEMRMNKDDPLQPYVENILASTERAANLTQSLLAFSRKQVISPKPIEMETIVQRAEKLLARLIGEDIEMRIVLSAGKTTIKADSGQIEQALINLATNARDAMPHGGRLTIETRVANLDQDFIKKHGYGEPGKYALLAVSDTGHGMDKKTLRRIFEPFFTTKEVGKGTGLGLAIVYGMVKQHGGYITVYSERNVGSTFKLYFPLFAAPIQQAKAAETDVLRGGSSTLLIAEDDDAVRTMTKGMLEGFGYSVIEAVDGEDAITKYRENRDRIEVLILDVIMPRKNGKEVYDAVRTMNPQVKALFMSGYTAEIIHKRGMLDQDLHFLPKPVSPKELLMKLHEMLAGPDRG